MKSFLLLSTLLIQISVFSQNSLLKSGPMLGYCEMKEAVIWVQTTLKASVHITYFDINQPKEIFKTETYTSIAENGFTNHLILNKIQPNITYNYIVYINNKKISLPYSTQFTSKKLWQWRENAPDFSIALGSCSYTNEPELDRPGKGYGSGYNIYNSIAQKNPTIMLWGGDNIYLREADWDTKTGIYHRYSHARALPELQPLFAKTQNYAIWDDHDFGPNDGDRGFYLKNTTQQAFKHFWANKTYGEDNKGIYTTFSWGDAQFFLLDNRFFKSPNERKTGNREILGTQQMQWLIDNLATSNASFKIIVIGGQVLNSIADFENYANYPQEKEILLSEIEKNNTKGVLFISGDRHFSELSMLSRPNTYPLYDWTVSPLTSGIASAKAQNENNIYRVSNSFFATNNFGIIQFSGAKENRQIELILNDKDGNEIWKKVILKKDLN